MCLAIPGKIVSVKDEIALTDFGGIRKDINISLVDAKKGDWVLVHVGFAIQKIEKLDLD